MIASSISLWNALRRALLTSLPDPEGAVRQRLLVELSRFAERLRPSKSAGRASCACKPLLTRANAAALRISAGGQPRMTVLHSQREGVDT